MTAEDRQTEFRVAAQWQEESGRASAHHMGRPFELRASHAIAAESLDYSAERVGKEKRPARFFQGLIVCPTELVLYCETVLISYPKGRRAA